ncbi:MAG TPA: hypothetical protein VFB14_13945 [Bryobacteraceae bacterium]|nr:hypothetical protein [Bryobacteraceae bacterium]
MERPCYHPECEEEAVRVCDSCDRWCCTEHSGHWGPEHPFGETTQCDECREPARY